MLAAGHELKDVVVYKMQVILRDALSRSQSHPSLLLSMGEFSPCTLQPTHCATLTGLLKKVLRAMKGGRSSRYVLWIKYP